MAQEGPGEPAVRIAGKPLRIEVKLARGQSICVARDPIWISDRLVATALSGATRWESTAEGMLCFAIHEAHVERLDLRKSAYAVASDLVLMWTDGARFEPFSLPGGPGFTRASGDGQAWLLLPGSEFYVQDPTRLATAYPPVFAVDPAWLAWVKLDAGHRSVSLAPAPGPGGRTWIQVSGRTSNVRLFSGPRPGQHSVAAPQGAPGQYSVPALQGAPGQYSVPAPGDARPAGPDSQPAPGGPPHRVWDARPSDMP